MSVKPLNERQLFRMKRENLENGYSNTMKKPMIQMLYWNIIWRF